MRTIGTNGVGTIRRWGQGVSYGAGSAAKQLQDWRLATTEDEAAVETAGYFNGLAADMRVGDLILASLALASTPVGKVYMCTANDGAVVTVTELDIT